MTTSQNLQELMVENIEAFSIKFGLPQLEKSGFLKREDMRYRIDFLIEELDELITAAEEDNLEDAFDALLDIVYVAVGTAWLMNLPFMDGWDRVHHANMMKVRAEDSLDPRSKRNHPWDVVKPEGWKSPDLSDLVK